MEEGKCGASVLAFECCNVSTGNKDRQENVLIEKT
jgi:hypothetical protein